MQSGWRCNFLALLRDERGNTLAEYGLVAAVLGVSMLAGVAALQNGTGQVLNGSANGWLNLALTPP
jgi:Flp pilus assembly pilin Flp